MASENRFIFDNFEAQSILEVVMGWKDLVGGKDCQDPTLSTRIGLQVPTAKHLLVRAPCSPLVLWNPKSVRVSGRILCLRKQDGGQYFIYALCYH